MFFSVMHTEPDVLKSLSISASAAATVQQMLSFTSDQLDPSFASYTRDVAGTYIYSPSLEHSFRLSISFSNV
jgi:hypothetical protein